MFHELDLGLGEGAILHLPAPCLDLAGQELGVELTLLVQEVVHDDFHFSALPIIQFLGDGLVQARPHHFVSDEDRFDRLPQDPSDDAEKH